MGYHTHYQLEWKALSEPYVVPSCEHDKPEEAQFCPTCGIPVAELAIEEKVSDYIRRFKEPFYGITPEGETYDAVKWYDHESDMKQLSREFPSILFTLSGEGEEPGDIWKKYFLNGKVQEEKAQIVIADFDMEKLQ